MIPSLHYLDSHEVKLCNELFGEKKIVSAHDHGSQRDLLPATNSLEPFQSALQTSLHILTEPVK